MASAITPHIERPRQPAADILASVSITHAKRSAGQTVTSRGPPVEPHPYRDFEHAGWQGAATRYPDSFAHATAAYVEALLDAAGAQPGAAVLDVACGPGIATAAALRRGCTAVGVDFSPAMLAVARERLPAATFHEGDAEALPLPSASVDAVISNFGLHHFPRPVRALREALRVLRSGGRLAVTVWPVPALNPAWQLVIDAVSRHGDAAPVLPTPPEGALNRPEDCVRLLVAAGAPEDQVSARVVEAARRVDAADGLLDAFAAGTVRMAALLAAQSPAALAAILDAMQRFKTDDGFRVPTAAVLVSGACDSDRQP
jgi:SAM-dependent methyltransferase